LEQRVLSAFSAFAPLFRETSCAVSYAHGLPDYNGHYGIRELCDICPPPDPGTAAATSGGQMPGMRVVSLVGDLSSGRPLVEQVPPQAPGSRSTTPDAGLATEVAALAALLAEVVQFAGRAAIFPSEREALADLAMEHHSVRTALLAVQEDAP
jgi:hypothetical protein